MSSDKKERAGTAFGRTGRNRLRAAHVFGRVMEYRVVWEIDVESQSPSSGACLRTRTRAQAISAWTRCRNRLRAAHVFGPVQERKRYRRGPVVAIAFERRMSSDKGERIS